MSKPKWTPWKYVGGGQIQGADGKQVAWLAGRTYPHDEQFGCLIAAAPELYEALAELLDAIEPQLVDSASSRSGRDDDDFREEFPEDYERCKRLREVLAKARGETP